MEVQYNLYANYPHDHIWITLLDWLKIDNFQIHSKVLVFH